MTGPGRREDPVAGPWDLDRGLIEAVQEDRRARAAVYPHPDIACVVGHGGDPWRETRPDLLARDGVPLRRRRGGGCAVVLDPGNLVCAAVLPWPGIADITRGFAVLGAFVADALATCGLPGVRQAGTSDLALGDRKLGGSCIWRTRGLLYYATTLLVDPAWDLIDRYLPHPPREPAYREGRPHRDFLTSLRRAGLTTPAEILAADLQTLLAGALPAAVPERA
jgi:lipoate---protein ligase